MADLVESRDESTGGHIQRTAKYVEIIANKLKQNVKYKDLINDEYMENIVTAAPLHDVGKIHIQDAILNKPDRLTDEEFEQMKKHTTAGVNIIDHVLEQGADSSYLDMAKEMAGFHHERMDGKGYPNGIKGDEIPLCARILAVADVFDALVSARCYKKPMPFDKAINIIREEIGDHFDEHVAMAFIESKDIVKTYLEDSDSVKIE